MLTKNTSEWRESHEKYVRMARFRREFKDLGLKFEHLGLEFKDLGLKSQDLGLKFEDLGLKF